MSDHAGEIDAYFAKQNDSVRDIALALRARLDALGPDLKVKLAWGYPCWIGNERIASVIAHSAHCNLQLWSGNRLADMFPGRISGTGKQLRHVKIDALEGADAEIDRIIKAAIDLDATDPQRVR